MYLFHFLGTRGGDEAGPGRSGAEPVGSITDIQEQKLQIVLASLCKLWYNETKQKELLRAAKEERKMEQRLKEVFDLDRIRAFTEAHIDDAEWIEVRPGERRRILVIETLVSGAHGIHIPGMVLDIFERADEFDLNNPYNWEKNEWMYDALQDLEDEVNDYLNESLQPKGIYYMGFHEYDGSYALFYEEWEEDDMIEVVVIEAGKDYTDPLERFEMELPEDEKQAVAEAIRAVAALGYTVIPNDQGGCCAYVTVTGDEDYIAITVEPGIKEE